MRIEGNTIYADEGKFLYHKGDRSQSAQIIVIPKCFTIDDYEEVDTEYPVIEETEDDFFKPIVETYDEKVNRLIREIYSESAEFALLRQRDTKPQEFQEYNSYCEDCKRRAKEEMK